MRLVQRERGEGRGYGAKGGRECYRGENAGRAMEVPTSGHEKPVLHCYTRRKGQQGRRGEGENAAEASKHTTGGIEAGHSNMRSQCWLLIQEGGGLKDVQRHGGVWDMLKERDGGVAIYLDGHE